MSRQDALLKLYQRLLTQRDALCKQLDCDISHAGDGCEGLGDSADIACDDVERELSTQLASLESRELGRIEAALEALRAGRYGTCDDCETAIPINRLQAVPYSTTCIDCQRTEERGGRKRGVRENWATACRDEARKHDLETNLENLSIPVEH